MNQLKGTLVDDRLIESDHVTGVRPEHVLFSSQSLPGGVPAVVERVIPRGHFTELVLARDDTTLHSYFNGRPPSIGDRGMAHITEALTFRDGVLVEDAR